MGRMCKSGHAEKRRRKQAFSVPTDLPDQHAGDAWGEDFANVLIMQSFGQASA